MEVFSLSYILLLTSLTILLIFIVYYAIKTDKVQFRGKKLTERRLKQLDGQKWICIRYVDTKDGKEYIREDEISYNQFMKSLLDTLDCRYNRK